MAELIVDPEVGQIWESLDPRDLREIDGKIVTRKILLFKMEKVGGHYDFLAYNIRTGIVSRIKEDRLRPRSNGYRFVGNADLSEYPELSGR